MKKRIVSILLAAVMLCALLPQTALFAFAEGEKTVVSITFTPVKPIERIENTHGYRWTDEHEQEYYHYHSYNLIYLYTGNKLTVQYSDGSTDVYENSKGANNYENSDGEHIGLDVSDDQAEKHWTLGSDNFFTVKYEGAQTQVQVTIVETPVASVAFTPAKPITYIENYGGWQSGDDYHYYDPEFEEGDKFTVAFKDGKKAEYVKQYIDSYMYSVFCDSDGNPLGEQPEFDTYQSEKPWTVGGENTATFTYLGVSTEVPVTVIENPVAAVEYKPVKPIVFVENCGGSKNKDWYYYNTPSFKEGDKLVVTYKDGKKKEYTYKTAASDDRYSSYRTEFLDGEGEKLEYNSPNIDTDQYSTHWTLGGENYMTFSYLNVTCKVPVKVIENPVASIDFAFASPVVLYENEGGYYENADETERYQKDEKGFYIDDYYEPGQEKNYVDVNAEDLFFFYSSIPVHKEGNKLTVHYKDGKTKVLTQKFVFNEKRKGYYFVDENGNLDDYANSIYFRWTITYDKPFKRGSDNVITFEYLNTKTTANVTVVENPVDRIEYNSFSPFTLNVDDPMDCADFEGGRSFHVSKMFSPGNSLKVYFKDGTTNTFNFYYKYPASVYHPVIGEYYYAVDESGSVMNYSCFSYSYDYNEEWKPGNSYEITLRYFGAETKVPVYIISDETEPPFSFKDVTKDAFYAKAVNWAVENGVTNGTGDKTFSPSSKCTRGQVVTFLWRAAGCPIPSARTNPFTDVKESSYCYNAVLWAVEKGVTNGISATAFGPNKECTRGQVVTFLWRANGSPKPTNTKHPFTDVKSDGFYYNAMLWAVEKGVTNGTSATAFGPNKTCTRGQVVTFLYRSK